MTAVLGIDAAWTPEADSGYALVANMEGRWRLKAASSNIGDFARRSGLESVARRDIVFGVEIGARLLGGKADLVAIDMPRSIDPITGRRCSDKSVSKRFGAAQCATHSPSATRPGEVSNRFRAACENAGYALLTTMPVADGKLALAEVYPHPALLRLLNIPKRHPYKVSKTLTYWKSHSPEQRLDSLKQSFSQIVVALDAAIEGVAGTIGEEIENAPGFSALKPVEDKIDAIVCAWVGIEILKGRAEPFGDASSAIWIPKARDGEPNDIGRC